VERGPDGIGDQARDVFHVQPLAAARRICKRRARMAKQGMAKPDVLIVTGPPASGKSALALALAERHGGTVINADAMQTYDAFPVLTAQPSAAERESVPH